MIRKIGVLITVLLLSYHTYADAPPTQNHYWQNVDPSFYSEHPVRDWHEGQFLPQQYQGHHFDWQTAHLPPPPNGYEWLRINGDYVLIQTVSQLITQILLGPRY